MTIPVLLIAGFLGAGKTTLVNQILLRPGNRRIAAIVNDFGAIDVDAALLGEATDEIIALKNGCICCSLQGDLMRALSTLLRHDPVPDVVVIETSGASDPAEIVRSLLDPAIFHATPLDTVVTVVDAAHIASHPDICADPLWRSQVTTGDFIVISKADLVTDAELEGVRGRIAPLKPARLVFEAAQGQVPWEIMVHHGTYDAVLQKGHVSHAAPHRFEAITWIAPSPISLARFQTVIGHISPYLLRAKGFVIFDHMLDRQLLFQLAGKRATIVPTSVPAKDGKGARIDFIAEAGQLDRDATLDMLNTSITAGSR